MSLPAVLKLAGTVSAKIACVHPAASIAGILIGATCMIAGNYIKQSPTSAEAPPTPDPVAPDMDSECSQIAEETVSATSHEDTCAKIHNITNAPVTKKSISARRIAGTSLEVVGGVLLTVSAGSLLIKIVHPFLGARFTDIVAATPLPTVVETIPEIDKTVECLPKILEQPPDCIDAAKDVLINYKEVLVQKHLRKLPKGQHASPEKILEAKALGINLAEGWTLVDDYIKSCSVQVAA